MTTSNRTNRLKELMAVYHLKAKDVGVILGREAHTVRVWRSAYKARVIPDHMLRLLESELAKKGQAGASE